MNRSGSMPFVPSALATFGPLAELLAEAALPPAEALLALTAMLLLPLTLIAAPAPLRAPVAVLPAAPRRLIRHTLHRPAPRRGWQPLTRRGPPLLRRERLICGDPWVAVRA
jgi:hypothetical protein